jgi:serine/threonine-protein kinase
MTSSTGEADDAGMAAQESKTVGLGEYELGESLGRGGMGEVFAATHPRLGSVVVKLMHAHLAAPYRARLKREGQVLAKIDSLHVVKVHELGYSDGGKSHPFLVMERLVGRTLDDELRERGFLPVDRALQITVDILSGLSAVHAAKVVHRDIKPSNIFLCEPAGAAKLLDFGVVGLVEAVSGVSALAHPTRAGAAVGTPRFMAPEQVTAGQIDQRADLYGVGAVLYQMLTGEHVFRAASSSDVMLAHALHTPAPPSSRAKQPIHPALDGIVERALAKSPDERFADAGAFIHAILALPAEARGAAAPATPPPVLAEERSSANEPRPPETPLPPTQLLPDASAASGSAAVTARPSFGPWGSAVRTAGVAPAGPPPRRPRGPHPSRWRVLLLLIALSFLATVALLEGWVMR